VLQRSIDRIARDLGDDALVLDVGGWAKPLPRADWVLDLMPHETRGLYGRLSDEPERFTADTWVQTDICARDPWPFDDNQFDFSVCTHTLEDVRDPIWVCGELNRVSRAGYLEVPSRLEEQSFGVHGAWVGWSHHRWLVDVSAGLMEFAFKPHMLQAREEFRFPAAFGAGLSAEQRVQTMFWEGGFDCRERIFIGPDEIDVYLASFVTENLAGRPRRPPARSQPRPWRRRRASA